MSASSGISLALAGFFFVVVVVVVPFWNSVSTDVSHLTSLARYMYNCFNSADAERSFSIYNLVFSDRRRRCSKKN